MRISVLERDEDEERRHLNTMGAEERKAPRVVGMDNDRQNKLDAIKARVEGGPYSGRRRGMDGVQRNMAGEKTREGGAVGRRRSESSGFLGSMLAVATTPLRAAWSIVGGKLGQSPSNGGLQSVDDDDGIEGDEKRDAGDREEDDDDVAVAVVEEEKTPGGVIGRGEVGIGDANTPERGEVKNSSPHVGNTPYDGVLGMLKDGPLARGGTPLRFPSPKSRQKAMKSDVTPMSSRLTQKKDINGTPGGSRLPARGQGKQLFGNGIPPLPPSQGKEFTFHATQSQLQKSTPAGKLDRQKPMVFGAMRGSIAKESSVAKESPLAWTPLRSTPVMPNSAARRFQVGSSTRFAPESRKRRADDVHGMTPSYDDGSVSVLDVQRRRRFKPNEDPSSVARRSWRAGRTPYQHMSHYKRRVDSQATPSALTPGVPVKRVSEIESPKPTSETARRILETLDSMEETIRKSRESVSPLDAQKYTMGAAPSPPPGSSLGGLMPLATEKETPKPADVDQQEKKTSEFKQAPLERSSPPSGREETQRKKVKRKVGGTGQVTFGGDAPATEKAPIVSYGFGQGSIKTTSNNPLFSAQAKVDEGASELYTFGKEKNALREKISEVVKDVLPSSTDGSEFKFGQDRVKVKGGEKSDNASAKPEQKPMFDFSIPTKCAEASAPSVQTGAFGSSFATQPSSDEGKPSTPAFSFGASKPEETKPSGGTGGAATTTAPASGWGSDFLQKNTATAAKVTAAVEEETKKADGEPAAKPSTPAFTFGASKPEETKPSDAATTAAASGWGSDFLQKNAATAAQVTAAVEEETKKADGEPAAKPSTPAFTFGASKPEETKPSGGIAGAATTTAPASGWGSDFLQKNAATAAKVTAAVEEETKKADGEPAAKPSTPAFTFGASKPEETKPSGGIAGAATTTAPASGWGSDFLQKNAATAAKVTAAVEEETKKADGEPAAKPSTPAFTFGASKPEETKPSGGIAGAATTTAPASGWGSDFLQKNTATAAKVTAAVEEETKKADGEPAAKPSTPVFTFGAPKTEEAKPSAPSFGLATSGTPSFSTQMDAGQTPAPTFQFGNTAATTSGSGPTSEPNKFTFGASHDKKPEDASTGGQGFSSPAKFTFGSAGSAPSTAPFAFGATPSQPSSGPAMFGSAATQAADSSLDKGQNPQSEAAVPGFSFGASANPNQSSAGTPFGASTGAAMTMDNSQQASGGFGNAGGFGSSGGFGNPGGFGGSGGFGNPGGFGNAGGFGGSGGFGAPQTGNAPFGANSSAAAFGAPPSQQPNAGPGTGSFGAFGQGAAQFGAPPQSSGFGEGFSAPRPFAPPSGPSQMIPNGDNPFGGAPVAGGFSVGSSGNSQSEGRRRVKVKRRNR